MRTLYHYTNRAGRDGIEATESIRKARKKYAFHGEGVYFNSRRANHGGVRKEDVAVDNYGINAAAACQRLGKVDYAVAVEFPEGHVVCCDIGRNLWLYPTDTELDLTKYRYRFFKV